MEVKKSILGEELTEYVDLLVAAIGAAGTLRRSQLLEIPEFRGFRPVQIEDLVRKAIERGLLVEEGGTLRATGHGAPPVITESEVASGESETSSGSPRPWRLVAIDFECVVRPTSVKPYLERRPYQVAALRFGRDRDWVTEREPMSLYCELPVGDSEGGWRIHDPDTAVRHAAAPKPRERWLKALDEVLEGADAVVAYNGDQLDFLVLEEERRRANLPPLPGVEKIDGLKLAVSVWPNPPRSARLAELARRLDINLDGLTWHEALSDCRILAAVCRAAGRRLQAMSPDLSRLVLSAAGDSLIWSMAADLAGMAVAPRPFSPDEVLAIMGAALEGRGGARRRERRPAEVELDEALMRDGHVDPQRLAELLHGPTPARPAQSHMADHLSAWMDEGRGGLVEAPTGTGKSLVLLAAALDWVRSDPGNQAVIATHTRQLQSQLARDVEDLSERGVESLGQQADLVKGAANRLALRALTMELAEATMVQHRRTTPRELRELMIFLLIRLVTARRLSEHWEALSVDRVDVPMVFAQPSEGRLAGWLHQLSQREHGEFDADAELVATLHTDRVAEALASGRVVIANHALLLSHRDDLAKMGDHLALFIDEAHELESAATEALSLTFDYQALERVPREMRRLVREAGEHPALGRAAAAIDRLERYLSQYVMARAASAALDQLSETGAIPGQRAVTVASPFIGRRMIRPVDALRAGLERAKRELTHIHRALASYAADPEGLDRAGRWTTENFFSAISLVIDQERAIGPIVATLDETLGPLRRERRARAEVEEAPPVKVPGHEAALARLLDVALSLAEDVEPAQPEPIEDDRADELFEFADETEVADEGVVGEVAPLAPEHEAEEVPHPELAPARRNDVVYISEGPSPASVAQNPRDLCFAIVSSPIALGESEEWGRFLAMTPRLVLTSGTLCVAGSFEYVRGRLGLNAAFDGVVLDTPFDLAHQARLYCLSDFPSWVEHPRRAVNSVAHQVAGFVERTSEVDQSGALTGGAMVLTTSKASAGAISEALAPRLAAIGVPLATSEILGNDRAVQRFSGDGGVLVGTRGLWQGLDVRDPERLRLVWINKLPFAPFASPLVVARRARAVQLAELAGAADPEREADEAYYLPLAALALRQAVGRLVRSVRHRGVIVISDAKLSGNDPRRRLYRRMFLGSLDPGLRRDVGNDLGAGNVMTMTEAWRDALAFGAQEGFVDEARVPELHDDSALARFVDLPEMVAIRSQLLDQESARELRAAGEGALVTEVLERCQRLAQILGGPDHVLHPEQREAIAAVARGDDLLALLPTGFGKSYCYQLPGLVLPGVTLVVSPLVSLMVDQAMGLGSTVGPMVRALTGPMRESNSRLGKSQVAETLRGERDHGIRLVYLSPERLADARFRALVREGAQRGVVARIAVDEAHCLVDWGDDFRPSYRRLDRFLAQLKAEVPELQISALTATANASVRSGLRTRLFDLGLERPPEGDREGFTLVEANPLRPELAIWRRRLAPRSGGASAVAGLVEAVVDALDCHAIFYCLTVREVEVLSASLREYLGEGHADRVLRYHGRLSSAEKAAVALAFRTAPRAEDAEDFRPLIVVATSAFGLGVDREDVRAVFCVSPPTDLAALYQQLGRAGRDCTHKVPGVDEVPTNAAMALVTPRAWRTLTWMARQGIPERSLLELASRLLDAAPVGSCAAVDPGELAVAQLEEELATSRGPRDARRTAQLRDELETGVTRVIAALAAVGGVVDLGDVPDRVRIKAGEVRCDDVLWQEILAGALAMSDGGDVELLALHRGLTAMPDYVEAIPTVADLWTGLAAAHDYGWLDVSQQSTRSRLVVYEVVRATPPTGLVDELRAHGDRVNVELERLRTWFDDSRCAHDGIAEAFGVAELPAGTCASPAVRCSAHWNVAHGSGSVDPAPALFEALFTPDPRASASTAEGRAAFERSLRRHLGDLLWMHPRGLHQNTLWRVLHGEDWWFDARRGQWRRLWPSLLYHRARGSMRGVRPIAIQRALERMVDAGDVVATGDGFFRWAPYVAEETERAARASEAEGAA